MSDVKQVKVANWGIYFLQRLKHFFNRTDYCDLTLQFQDNAQLKVHRLVLSACTEYFELLERTCEMYEDCLVMPDDLQADVVVPIVNFMYTGQLEFRMELLDRLYQTSQILNLPVLTKLLDSHRNEVPKATPTYSYSSQKKFSKSSESGKVHKPIAPSTSTSNKRSYSKAFDSSAHKEKKLYHTVNKSDSISNSHSLTGMSPISDTSMPSRKQPSTSDPRPSRYELPEELDQENIFDNSFCNISYTSKPLMIHPETVKRYSSKKRSFGEASSSRKFAPGISTLDIVECKRIGKPDDSIFDDSMLEHGINDESDMFPTSYINLKEDTQTKDPNQLFDQILDQNEGPKVTIETKDSKLSSNIDHAKIISEVLKKYPHLVKSNKNIKLKILNTQSNTKPKRQQKCSTFNETKPMKLKLEPDSDFTYETDVLDSKEAARLIAMGAENVKGPWICLICGTTGKALHFTSYYKFRRHLVDVHREKPVSNICEYCGLKSLKRNYLLHHLYSQHGVDPPPQYHFPKCNKCNYIALTEGFLVKHKMTHVVRHFRCNVCAMSFNTSNQLLLHIQNTGHKYSGDRKTNLQCIYCLKVFLREINLYAHLKTHHKKEAKSDGIIEDSDEEKVSENEKSDQYHNIKLETSRNFVPEYEVDVQFQIQQKPDSDPQVVSRKPHTVNASSKQKILNSGLESSKSVRKPKAVKNQPERSEFLEDIPVPINNYEEIIMIDNNEYIMRDHQLIPRKEKLNDEYILSDLIHSGSIDTMQPTTSMEFTRQPTNIEGNVQQSSMIIKNPSNLSQPIQIMVSNEEEYKALMSSNHPIIFDNSDANKTLTVLTAHDNTLEPSSIDLDKSQSSNMMIIPEDYPLNVTETVSAENQNIVVVYSHPVHDPNKQYQIITTQGVGAQFVQSSAIITQNFETVTTSTPVMSAHVLQTHVEPTWQNNVQVMETSQEQITPHSELHTIIQSNHMEIDQNQISHDLQGKSDNQLEAIPAPLIPVEKSHQLPPIEQIKEIMIDGHSLTESSHVITSELHNPSQSFEPPLVQDTCVLQDSDPIHRQVTCENGIHKESDTYTHTESLSANETLPQDNTENNDEESYNNDVTHEPMETENDVIETLKEVAPQLQEQEHIGEPSVESVDQSVESVDQSVESMDQSVHSVDPSVESVDQSVGTENSLVETVEPSDATVEPSDATVEPSDATVETSVADGEPPVVIMEPSVATVEPSVQTVESSVETSNLIVTKSNALLTESISVTHISDSQETAVESQVYTEMAEMMPIPSEDVTYTEEAEKKIQNLTSEWSEDEYDVPEETEQPAEIAPKAVEEPQQEESEAEETIENIRHEVEKQMTATSEATTTENTVQNISPTEENIECKEEPQHIETAVEPDTLIEQDDPKQKISSLLNDWEDNDSQEDNSTSLNNDSQEQNVSVNDNVIADKYAEDLPGTDLAPVTEAQDPKFDNIKKLVSDWDEEDEDNKE